MQSAEDVALTFADGWPMSDGALTALTDLIRERDAQVRDAERAKVLAGFTEERADRMVARRVPCDCPGDWQHHGRFVGDDGPEMHASFEAVPSRRLVSPWEPTP